MTDLAPQKGGGKERKGRRKGTKMTEEKQFGRVKSISICWQ